MKLWKNIFKNNEFRIMDDVEFSFLDSTFPRALHSFAIDDALSEGVTQEASLPVMRFWVHDHTTVLGIPDARLPHIEDGIHFLHRQQNDIIVRNSGGLAVALDAGVLNISLIIPRAKELSIYDGYEMMVYFIQQILAPFTSEIEAYEIVGSYCPGDYDLSINGKKFAGISQRRIRDAASIQIYLDICGDSAEKAERIREFYSLATKNQVLKTPPPQVQKEKMANLSELTNCNLTVAEIKERAITTLQVLSKGILKQDKLTSNEENHYTKRLKQIITRNESIQEFIKQTNN